jgi:hypothetical protein
MNRAGLAICLFGAAQLGYGQVASAQSNDDPTFTRIKDLVVAAQREIKPMKGFEASECFTDDDKKQFDKNEDAKRIATKATGAPEFKSAIKDLAKQRKDYQKDLLTRLRAVRDKTYGEVHRFGDDVQTDAGAAAQAQIASEIAGIMGNGLPCCKP